MTPRFAQTTATLGNEFYAQRQSERESNARTYARRLGISIVRAKGAHVFDANGMRYFDCLCAAGTLVLGHNHSAVVAAVTQAIQSEMAWQTLDIATPTKDAFVEAVFSTLPEGMRRRARIQFCSPSGSDAVEAALKLVKIATGNSGILAFSGGYHGMTHGSLALMGNTGPKSIPGLMPGAQFLPYPHSYRCPFGVGGDEGARLSSQLLRGMLADVESGICPAAMVLEVVQGEGGVIPAPDAWIREMREMTRERGVPMIVDEVQTGWGRTGRLYAFEQAGIVPDVLVLSKAIGGGLPLSVIVYDESLDKWQPGAHAGTFRGNQLAMVAGLATLRILREENIPENAARMGERMRGHLHNIAAELPSIGDVRGKGLMLGVELVDPDGEPDRMGHPPPDGAYASRVQRACLERGLIIEMGGRYGAVARFLSPLNIDVDDVDSICERFRDACRAARQEKASRAANAQ